ncbi:MAG: cupredoxin domain-containing protein [Steroidobacteraceae bacterium]
MNPRASLLICAAVAGGIALAGCGGGTSPAPANPAPTAVTIRNFAFSPTPLTVSRGAKVTWTNQDSSVHTVTAVDSSFDSGNLAQGQSFTRTFDSAGTFAYRCNIHQYMTATVVID